MSEYRNDPAYGKDDFGTVCIICAKWDPKEGSDFCSDECENVVLTEMGDDSMIPQYGLRRQS